VESSERAMASAAKSALESRGHREDGIGRCAGPPRPRGRPADHGPEEDVLEDADGVVGVDRVDPVPRARGRRPPWCRASASTGDRVRQQGCLDGGGSVSESPRSRPAPEGVVGPDGWPRTRRRAGSAAAGHSATHSRAGPGSGWPAARRNIGPAVGPAACDRKAVSRAPAARRVFGEGPAHRVLRLCRYSSSALAALSRRPGLHPGPGSAGCSRQAFLPGPGPRPPGAAGAGSGVDCRRRPPAQGLERIRRADASQRLQGSRTTSGCLRFRAAPQGTWRAAAPLRVQGAEHLQADRGRGILSSRARGRVLPRADLTRR